MSFTQGESNLEFQLFPLWISGTPGVAQKCTEKGLGLDWKDSNAWLFHRASRLFPVKAKSYGPLKRGCVSASHLSLSALGLSLSQLVRIALHAQSCRSKCITHSQHYIRLSGTCITNEGICSGFGAIKARLKNQFWIEVKSSNKYLRVDFGLSVNPEYLSVLRNRL